MALVGDVIISMRRLGPDAPQVMLPPGSAAFSSAAVTAAPAVGGTIPVGTWFVVATALNQWGESLASNEVSAVLTPGNQTISVSIPFQPGVVNYRVYIGLVSGSESLYFQQAASAPGGGTLVNIGTLVGLIPATPPVVSTAYLPDTDGRFVGVSNAYEWLNEALDRLGFTSSGFPDETGTATVVGQPYYQLSGQWVSFDHAWFDGWEMGRVNRSNFYYHNTATGISWMLSVSKVGANPYVQVWPQPNRSGGTTTLSLSMLATDNVANITSAGGFSLPFGLASIDSGSNLEIVSYAAFSSTQLTGLIRGLGGYQPQAHSAGAQVSELNVRLSGKRLCPHYSIGASASYLDVPYGMDNLLATYMLYKYRLKEQQHQEAAELYQNFLALVKEGNRTNRQLAGPTQAGQVVQRDIYGTGAGGGWFVP